VSAAPKTKTIRTYQVALHSGAVEKFNSSMSPTHAVTVAGMLYTDGTRSDVECRLSAHGSFKAAEKGAATARGRGWENVKIVECIPV
jgi:hypothetical protein